MKSHRTKDKGDLGVLEATLDLTKKGFLVCKPETEHAPFDIVVYDKQTYKFYRIQCKYFVKDKSGSIRINFRTNKYNNSKGGYSVAINKNEIDFYSIYCPDTDEMYYLDPKKFETGVNLRIDTPKNNQSKNINKAKDFLTFPPIGL